MTGEEDKADAQLDLMVELLEEIIARLKRIQQALFISEEK